MFFQTEAFSQSLLAHHLAKASYKCNHLSRRPAITTMMGTSDLGSSGGSATVIERPQTANKSKVKTETSGGGGDGWELKLFDDSKNYRSYVADCLVTVVGLSEARAYEAMMQAHEKGWGYCGEYCQEMAETYKEGLQNHGLTAEIFPV